MYKSHIDFNTVCGGVRQPPATSSYNSFKTVRDTQKNNVLLLLQEMERR